MAQTSHTPTEGMQNHGSTGEWDNEYPSNWHAGIGEANLPLDDGGYYLHLYYRVLPGTNQHTERYLELRVDTVNMPPTQHALELNYNTADGREVCRQRRLTTHTVDVSEPESEDAQQNASDDIHALADHAMIQYSDWAP